MVEGTAVEGNMLVRLLMEQFGVSTAIILVKLLATVCIMVVCIAGAQIKWVRPALISLIGIYTLLAVIPWSGILLIY